MVPLGSHMTPRMLADGVGGAASVWNVVLHEPQLEKGEGCEELRAEGETRYLWCAATTAARRCFHTLLAASEAGNLLELSWSPPSPPTPPPAQRRMLLSSSSLPESLAGHHRSNAAKATGLVQWPPAAGALPRAAAEAPPPSLPPPRPRPRPSASAAAVCAARLFSPLVALRARLCFTVMGARGMLTGEGGESVKESVRAYERAARWG